MEVCAPKSKIFKIYITSSAILYGDGDALISIFIVVHKLPFLLYALTCIYVYVRERERIQASHTYSIMVFSTFVQVESIVDTVQELLRNLSDVNKENLKELKKRKLITNV